MIRQRQFAADSPWQSREMTGWQMSAGGDGLSPIPILHLETDGASAEIRFSPRQADGAMTVGINDDKRLVRLIPLEDGSFTAVIGARRQTVRIHQQDQTVFVHDLRGTHTLTAIPYLNYISAAAETSGELRAPMMGMILKVNVTTGDRIRAGDVAAVLESMKMELRITSETDGVVTAVNCRAGDTVERNAVVVVVEPDRQP
jgi:3-methylcrotonyl-CoA carboxylase alpha subunit